MGTASETKVITPEMIDAGVEVLFQFDPDYSDAEKYVVKIFMAMVSVRQKDS